MPGAWDVDYGNTANVGQIVWRGAVEKRGDNTGIGFTQASPLRTAHTAACVRSETPTLWITCWTCSLTVS